MGFVLLLFLIAYNEGMVVRNQECVCERDVVCVRVTKHKMLRTVSEKN
jgi:hypothetical protein